MACNYTIFLFICLFIMSCSDDDNKHQGNIALELNISVYNSPRISKNDFQTDDQVGLYLVDYTADGIPGILGNLFNTRYVNVAYIYNSTNWYADDGQEIFVTGNYSDLYAYYPYDPEMSKTPNKMNLGAYPFSVETDQRNFSAPSDFLWAKVSLLSAADPQANIIFRHLMGKFEINLKFDNPSELPSDPQLRIYNTQISSTINLRTGVVSPVGETKVIDPYKIPDTNTGFDFTYNAIVVPQFLPQGTPLFSVTTNGATLIYETESDITIVPQNVYTFNMSVINN